MEPGPQSPSIEDYQYDVDNRLRRIVDGDGDVLKQFSYDPLGNIVQLVTPTGTTSYEYDYRNLLVRVQTPTDMIEYEYDGAGERSCEECQR